jgi:GNAT superfamily N-acetyltransferase
VTGPTGAPRARLAGGADLAAVLALYRELRPADPVLPAARATALWEQLLADPHIAIVVVDDQLGPAAATVAATCMLAIIPNLASGGRPIGLIEHVITGQAFRRRGLGRAVLQAALQRAWARGCCKVLLLSGAQRPQAHRLYESVGFDGDVERGFVAKPVANPVG